MEVQKERDGDAQYFSSFFYIQLPFKAKHPITRYTQKELGTLVHEYVHFLQNLTTPWGLYETSREFERIASLFADLQGDTSPFIYVPYPESYLAQKENVLKILSIGRGGDVDANGGSVYDIRLAAEPQFQISNQDISVGERTYPRTILEFNTEIGNRVRINFGAWTIKESMAALIQQRIDPGSAERHCDVPYDIVRQLAKDKYPNIWEDEEKLVVICYCSLMSLSPAIVFQDICNYANDHEKLSAVELLNYFFKEKHIKACKRNLLLTKFYQILSEKFITVLEKLMLAEKADYIKTIVRNTQISEGIIPLLALLQPNLNSSSFQKIMESAGTPNIFGTEDTMVEVEYNGKPISEMLQLLGYETIYKFLIKGRGECPRKFICETCNKDLTECSHTPWIREDDCPMTVIADFLKIREKGVFYQ